MLKRKYVLAVSSLTIILVLVGSLFYFSMVKAQADYDPWADITGSEGEPDGAIDMRDIAYVARLFGSSGTPINHAAVQFKGNISVPAAAFVPSYDGYDWVNSGWRLRNHDTTVLSYWFAQVQLPHGANITNLTSYWYDINATNSVNCMLWRYNQTVWENMAGAWPPFGDMPGHGSYEAPAIQHEIVDNNKYAYYLQVNVPGPWTDYYFEYAVIEWEYQ